MSQERFEQDDGWETLLFEKVTKGIDNSVRSDLLSLDKLTEAKNVTFQKDQVLIDTGYQTFLGTVVGIPRAAYQFFKRNGTSDLILVTNTTIYKLALAQWQFISSGVSTTASAGEAAGSTAIDVASTTGFIVGRRVGIILDNGAQHQAIISTITPGSPGVLNIDTAIPVGRSVAVGAQVLQAVLLNGSLDKHVSLVTLPFNDWLVFTNGVDNVKRYNGTDCVDVPNLPSSGNTQCKVVQLFNNYLLLINTTEGGTNYPQRVRRCDTSDPTNWTTGNAGFTDLYGREDFLLGAEELGPYMILYRERSIIRMEYVGTEDRLFNFDDTISGEGVFSSDAILNLGDYHIFFGNANVYEYRGGFSIEPIGDALYGIVYGTHGELNPSFRGRSFALYVEELDDILFLYPAGESEVPNKAVRFKPSEESWAKREFTNNFVGYGFYQEDANRTWASLVGSWLDQGWTWDSNALQANAPVTLLCGETDQVFEYNYITTADNGVGIPYIVATKDIVHPRMFVRTDRLSFRAKGSNISVERSINRGASWTVLTTANPGVAYQDIHVDSQAVAKSFRFRLKGTGGGFALDWIQVKHRLESEY